jgi:hypothetical protein
VLLKKLVQNGRPHTEVCLTEARDGFAEVKQASLGGLVDNGKRSEHWDASTLRLSMGFIFVDYERHVKFSG